MTPETASVPRAGASPRPPRSRAARRSAGGEHGHGVGAQVLRCSPPSAGSRSTRVSRSPAFQAATDRLVGGSANGASRRAPAGAGRTGATVVVFRDRRRPAARRPPSTVLDARPSDPEQPRGRRTAERSATHDSLAVLRARARPGRPRRAAISLGVVHGHDRQALAGPRGPAQRVALRRYGPGDPPQARSLPAAARRVASRR